MKTKITLLILLCAAAQLGLSQGTAHLDSSFHYNDLQEDGSWGYMVRSVYNPNTASDVTRVVHHNRSPSFPDWNWICGDSIKTTQAYKVHYTQTSKSDPTYRPVSRTLFRHDTQNRVTAELEQEGVKDDIFQDRAKTEYTYTAKGEIASKAISSWRTSDREWFMHERDQYTYYSNGAIASKAIERLKSGELTPREKEIYIYNLDGNIEETEIHIWSADESWVKMRIERYRYNAAGDVTEKITDYKRTNGFESLTKAVYVYDGQRRLSTVTTYNYLSTTSSWSESIRNAYEYSADGLTQTNRFESFIDGSWEEVNRQISTQTPQGDLASYLEYGANRSSNDHGFRHYYTYTSTSIAPDLTLNCKLPNPLSPQASLRCEQLESAVNYEMNVRTFDGKLVRKDIVQKGHSLGFLQGLPQGLYLISISENNNLTFSQKVMITP
ncbi:MAG: T9SS type A sorting domain-containing protein [Bacteroidia bacterium]